MIKNIIFDMGKVLVGYDSRRVCEHYMDNPKDIEQVCTAVFVSPEWLLLDMGVITQNQAMEQIYKRLPEQRLKEMALICMEHWHEYCMWPVPGMEELVKSLKDKGYGLYLCSNASVRLLDCYQTVIPGIGYFDGVLFSAQVKCMKPQKEMYRALFDRFHLRPQECFFIDDSEVNIEGARDCGMDGYCFDGNQAALRKVLDRLGK